MEQTHSATFPVAPENWKRGFWSLIVTQFQGAFSDNALQKLVTVLVLGMGLPPALRDRFVPALAAVFLMGVHSAIFGPSKYGLLPELLPRERLSWGNGVIELGTFLAIIFGTATGPLLAQYFHGRQYWSGALLVTLALVGLGTSFGITRVPAANPARKFR